MSSARTSLLVSVALVCLIIPPTARGQSSHTNELVEAAKKEGKLVWYTTMAIDGAKPLIDAFMKQYPFIKAELVRLSGSVQLLNRIMAETRAGQWLFDVAQGTSMPLMVKQNIVSPYRSPEREAFIEEFKDPQGYWTGFISPTWSWSTTRI